MNYFAHGLASVATGDAWLVAGTALPDWLRAAGRRLRASPERAAAAAGGSEGDPRTRSLARGVVRHFADDAWFHACGAFRDASADVADIVRPLRAAEPRMRPSFVAHLLVETLLDAELARRDPVALDAYYALLGGLGAVDVAHVAGPLATGPTEALAPLLRRFVESRFLADHADDGRIARRLDRVFARVRQPPVAAALEPLIPACRVAVAARADDLVRGAEGRAGPSPGSAPPRPS